MYKCSQSLTYSQLVWHCLNIQWLYKFLRLKYLYISIESIPNLVIYRVFRSGVYLEVFFRFLCLILIYFKQSFSLLHYFPSSSSNFPWHFSYCFLVVFLPTVTGSHGIEILLEKYSTISRIFYKVHSLPISPLHFMLLCQFASNKSLINEQ